MSTIYLPKSAFVIPEYNIGLMNSFNFPLNFRDKRYITNGHIVLDIDYAEKIIERFNQYRCHSTDKYRQELQQNFDKMTAPLEKGKLTPVYLKKDKYTINKKACARFESGLLEDRTKYDFYIPRNQIISKLKEIKFFTLDGREVYILDKFGNLVEIVAMITLVKERENG